MSDTGLELILTPEGEAFMRLLFPEPLDEDTYLSCICGFGRVGNGETDEFTPDEDLKEGLYWSEILDPEENVSEWAQGGFTKEAALDFCKWQMMFYLYINATYREKGEPEKGAIHFRILLDKSRSYQFWHEFPNAGSTDVRVIEKWAEGKVPTETPGYRCVIEVPRKEATKE